MLHGKTWSRMLDKIQEYSAIFSIFANTFLIYLIVTKSPKQIGAYKYLMISISTFEIFYSILDAVLYPFHHSTGSALLVIVSTKDRLLDDSVLTFLNSVYWGCFGASLAIFGVHFVYRYLVASGNRNIQYFNSWKICFWMTIPLAFGLIWFTVGMFLCGPTESFTRNIKDNVKETFDLNEDEFIYLGPYFYEKTDNTTVLRIAPIIGITINWITIAISFFTVIFFGFKCWICITNLVKITDSSSNTNVLQTQLFYALVVQTMIPVFLMHIPASIVFTFTFLDVDIGIFGSCVSMTIALYPAIDPLPNLFIIQNYRKAIFGEVQRENEVEVKLSGYFGYVRRRFRNTSSTS